MTLGDIYDRLTDDQRKRAFFLFWGVVEFYADADTWFAVALLPDPPAGAIMHDFRQCPDLHRRAPGGRARLAFAWVLSMFGKVDAMREKGEASR